MNHTNINDIHELLSGTLDNEKEKTILNHISNCKKCGDIYSSLLSIHNNLKQIKEDEAPENLNSLIFGQILKTQKSVKDGKGFFISVLSIFTFAIFAVIGFVLNIAMGTAELKQLPTGIRENTSQYINQSLSQFYTYVSGDNLKTLSLVIVFILMLAAYFLYESYRRNKNLVSS